MLLVQTEVGDAGRHLFDSNARCSFLFQCSFIAALACVIHTVDRHTDILCFIHSKWRSRSLRETKNHRACRIRAPRGSAPAASHIFREVLLLFIVFYLTLTSTRAGLIFSTELPLHPCFQQPKAQPHGRHGAAPHAEEVFDVSPRLFHHRGVRLCVLAQKPPPEAVPLQRWRWI